MELDQILQLIDKVSDSSLTAFDYEADGIKIAMEHGKAAPVQVQMSGVPSGAGLQMAEMMGGANGVTAKEAAMPERKETAGKSTAAEDHSEAEEGVFCDIPAGRNVLYSSGRRCRAVCEGRRHREKGTGCSDCGGHEADE